MSQPGDDHLPPDYLAHEQQIEHVQVDTTDHAAAIVHDALAQQVHETLMPHDLGAFDQPPVDHHDSQMYNAADTFHPSDDPTALFDPQSTHDTSFDPTPDHAQYNSPADDPVHTHFHDDPSALFDPVHHDDANQYVDQNHHDDNSAAAGGNDHHDDPSQTSAGHHDGGNDGRLLHDPGTVFDPIHTEIVSPVDIQHIEGYHGVSEPSYHDDSYIAGGTHFEDIHATGVAHEHDPLAVFDPSQHEDPALPLPEPIHYEDPTAVFDRPHHDDAASFHNADAHALQAHHEQEPSTSVFDQQHDSPPGHTEHLISEENHHILMQDEASQHVQHDIDAHVLLDHQLQDDQIRHAHEIIVHEDYHPALPAHEHPDPQLHQHEPYLPETVAHEDPFLADGHHHPNESGYALNLPEHGSTLEPDHQPASYFDTAPVDNGSGKEIIEQVSSAGERSPFGVFRADAPGVETGPFETGPAETGYNHTGDGRGDHAAQASAHQGTETSEHAWDDRREPFSIADNSMPLHTWGPELFGDTPEEQRTFASRREELHDAMETARRLGWVDENYQPLLVDLAGQFHEDAAMVRPVIDPSGDAQLQSAHLLATSFLQRAANIKEPSPFCPGYNRDEAVTVLLPAKVHQELDSDWRSWARQESKERATCTVKEMLQAMKDSIQAVDSQQLSQRQKDTLYWMLELEAFDQLNLHSADLLRVPFAKAQK